jgi:DNA repair protein RecO (recombination protein O)
MVINIGAMFNAYLLHRTPYSNSSLLVECFTREHGRFPAIAKGVKGNKKHAQVLLQPFNPILIKFSGKGEVKTLSGYEQEADAPILKGKNIYCGFYLNEIMMRILARNDPHADLFTYYENALRELSATTDIEPALRSFEVALLNELGYGLLLEEDVETGEQIKHESFYTYELERGPREIANPDSNAINGSTLYALAGNIPYNDREKSQARRLMRRVLAHYLGDRPLKSRELFKSFSGNKI